MEDYRNPGPAGVDKPAYVPPEITTYSQEDVVRLVGPALPCSGSDCVPSDTYQQTDLPNQRNPYRP